MGEVGGQWGSGRGGGVYPGPIVSDVVSEKTLSTKVEDVDVRRAHLHGTSESMKYANRKSPTLPPSACGRCREFLL